MKKQYVSVILPTYNERGNIGLLIDAIYHELTGYEHEVIVVDDNSDDGTYAHVVEKACPFVRVFLRIDNRGLAYAIRFGIEQAHGSVIIVMDSDFNHQPQYIPFMLRQLSYYDCVTALRFISGGRMNSFFVII